MSSQAQITNRQTLVSAKQLLEQSKPQIQARLPKDMDPDRFLLGVYTAIQKNPTLLDCDPNKLLLAALDAAEAGCNLQPSLQHGWLIPYKPDVNFQPSYRFFIQKAYETGDVRSFYAEVVYEGDKFDRQYAPKKNLFHAPGTAERTLTNAVGAYALVEFNDGSLDWEYLTREQIDKHRGKSKQPNSMKWTEFWWEGWRITPIRVLSKRLPIKSRELENLVTLLNREVLDLDTVETVRAPARRLSEAQNTPELVAEPDKKATVAQAELGKAATQTAASAPAAQATQEKTTTQTATAAEPQGSLLQEEPGKYVSQAQVDEIWATALKTLWTKKQVEDFLKRTHKVNKVNELLATDFQSVINTLREAARP